MVYIIINLTQKIVLGGTYRSLKSAKEDIKQWRGKGADTLVLVKTIKSV